MSTHSHRSSHSVLTASERVSLARYGKLLEVLTICWAGTEATVALWSASRTGSASLAGFGWDSVIEVLSALALWWRMSHEMNHERRHRSEQLSIKFAGICLLALSAYVFADACWHLYRHEHATVGRLGIAITAAAVVLMPVLSREKRRVGTSLHSHAMIADAKQTDFCMYQAAIVLLGLVSESVFGITWADSLAALVLVPILIRVGVLTLRGEHNCALH